MANLSPQDFIFRLETDPSFRAETGITSSDISLEDFQARAAAAGFDYSPDQIVIATGSREVETLTDEDLDQVTGGTNSTVKGQAPDGPPIRLVFQFKLVAVK